METHPFYPADLILPTYVPNDTGAITLVSLFASGCIVISGLAIQGFAWYNPTFELWSCMTVIWFLVSGCIHCLFEGYYIYNYGQMPSKMDIFGQLWKEYALSDSRYMSSDPLLLCMEILSVFGLGPLCLLTAWLSTSKSGYRYSMQTLVSVGHIYSNLLYFATSLYDEYFLGIRYSRPQPFYFWGYFVFMNAIWIFIPCILIYSSMRVSAKAFTEVEATRRKVKDLYNSMKDTRTRVKAKGADRKDQ